MSMWRASNATRRRWENRMRLKCAEQCQLLKAQWDGYSDALCRACTPMLPPIAASLGTPFSRIITIPISIYRVIGMVMIAFVGVATFNKSGKGATSILQAVIWVSPKRQLRNITLAPCCSYYAACAACAWCGWRRTRFLDSGDDLQDPRHTGCPLYRSREGLVGGPIYVWLSGAEGEELSAALALCMGGIDLMQPP